MKPYWESKLTLEQAQNFSEDGMAIFGNPAMKDIIWPRDALNPKMWINKGYKEITEPERIERFRNRVGWVPHKPVEGYDDAF